MERNSHHSWTSSTNNFLPFIFNLKTQCKDTHPALQSFTLIKEHYSMKIRALVLLLVCFIFCCMPALMGKRTRPQAKNRRPVLRRGKARSEKENKENALRLVGADYASIFRDCGR